MFELSDSTADSTPSRLAFTGNPIVLSDDTDDVESPLSGYPFSMNAGGQVYAGRYTHPYLIDVAELADAFAKPIPAPGAGTGEMFGPLCMMESAQQFAAREVVVEFEGPVPRKFAFFALPGGVSKQVLRALGGVGSDRDIFTEHFCAPGKNIFLTVRTFGRLISMKETELMPLYFINDTAGASFSVKDRLSGRYWTVANLPKGLYSIDPDTVRRHFYDDAAVLVNDFEFSTRNHTFARLIIEESQVSAHRCRVVFLNSLGVFEAIELTGSPTVTPEASEDEDSSFNVYDPMVADYVQQRQREPRNSTITINTGPKRPDEIRLIMDMLNSSEVWLEFEDATSLKVLPSAQEFSYDLRPTAPAAFSIAFTPAEADKFILPDYINPTNTPGVFSEEFDDTFN